MSRLECRLGEPILVPMQPLSLFPDPDEHSAFVQVVELAWPMEGHGFSVHCPGCLVQSGAIYELYEPAYEHAVAHRIANEAEVPFWELPAFGEGR